VVCLIPTSSGRNIVCDNKLVRIELAVPARLAFSLPGIEGSLAHYAVADSVMAAGRLTHMWATVGNSCVVGLNAMILVRF
jgi:hypothetical protein